MTMSNPLGRGAITRTHAPFNPKLHKIRVPVSPNRKLFLIQMTRPFRQPSDASKSPNGEMAGDYRGMLIS